LKFTVLLAPPPTMFPSIAPPETLTTSDIDDSRMSPVMVPPS